MGVTIVSTRRVNEVVQALQQQGRKEAARVLNNTYLLPFVYAKLEKVANRIKL
jgi:hypothetical protein